MHRSRHLVIALSAFLLGACPADNPPAVPDRDSSPETESSRPSRDPSLGAAQVRTSGPSPTTPPSPSAIPEGSGDYSALLLLAERYRQKEIDWKELEARVIAMKLPPHGLGDGYLMTPSPVPPPGVAYDPRMMPADWEDTWGEVAMVFWLGKLTREEYDQLHLAAHPGCTK